MNPTKFEDYKSGQFFTATIEGYDVQGVIQVEDGRIYLCQNIQSGQNCSNKRGYAYSWTIKNGSVYELASNSVINLVLFDVEPNQEITIQKNKDAVNYPQAFDLAPNEFIPFSISELWTGMKCIIQGTYEGTILLSGYDIYIGSIKPTPLYSCSHNVKGYSHLYNITIPDFIQIGIICMYGENRIYHSSEEIKKFSRVYDVQRNTLSLVRSISDKFVYTDNGKFDRPYIKLQYAWTKQEIKQLWHKLIHSNPLFSYVSKPNKFPVDWKPNSDVINSNLNFIEKGKLDKDWNFKMIEIHNWAECCALTKTTDDLKVYIPVEWLNYAGYKESHVKSYVKFLNGIFGEEVYRYNGIGEVPNLNFSIITSLHSTTRLFENKFYIFYIKADAFYMITYLRFIMLRYMYNYCYNVIPKLCLQTKFDEPELSNWDIMIMAHSYYNFKTYYSFGKTDIDYYNQKIGLQPIENVLHHLQREDSMNSSFQHIPKERPTYMQNFKKLFQEKKYSEIIKHLTL